MLEFIGRAHDENIRIDEPSPDDDLLSSLCWKVCSLSNADRVLAFEFDLERRISRVITTVVATGDRDLQATGNVIAGRWDAELTDCKIGVGVRRLELPSGEGEALAVQVNLAGVVVMIAAFRSRPTASFTLNEERAVRRLEAWIFDYAQIWWRHRQVSQRAGGLRAALESAGTATFILDHRSHLSHANTAARRLLRMGDGLRLVGGVLAASSFEDSVFLQTAIAHAGSITGPRPVALQLSMRRSGRRPLSVVVTPGASEERLEARTTQVVVHAVDPDRDVGPQLLPVCAMFRFTGAETRLAAELVGGASLADAATRLRIRIPTANTYLKQVFAKNGDQSPSCADPASSHEHRSRGSEHRIGNLSLDGCVDTIGDRTRVGIN